MENESNDIILNLSGSGRRNSRSSSLRRGSLSLSRNESFQIDDDVESRSVSEAGDTGDRFLNSKRHSESTSIRFSLDNASEHGVVFPIFEDKFKSHESTTLDTNLPVSPLPEGTLSPLSTDAMMSKDDKRDGEVPIILPQTLELISCLFYLSVFGILGVLTRYLLQKLFGPTVARVTSDRSILYLDLPSNMVGSFLMGWLGVVFKPDIARISDHLAIGLTTGYLGSVTTFSGWNQKMLDLAIDGQWVFSAVGFLVGLFLAAYSIKYGIATAKSFKFLLESQNRNQTNQSNNWRVDTLKRHAAVLLALGLLLVTLWSLSGVFLKEEFDGGTTAAQLWLACLVAAPGVWLRWFLARLNGRGLGKTRSLKWVPFGTLIANVSASCVMAALATLKKAVDTKDCNTVASGIQLGFLGCLSTVSTFIAEYNAMEESSKPWRATAYSLSSILISFSLGILIYAVPVWTHGYD